MHLRCKLGGLKCILGDSCLALYTSDVADIPMGKHRFQPGRDSSKALCEVVSGEDV